MASTASNIPIRITGRNDCTSSRSFTVVVTGTNVKNQRVEGSGTATIPSGGYYNNVMTVYMPEPVYCYSVGVTGSINETC